MTVLPMWPKVFGGPLTQDTGFAVIASGQSFAVCGNIRATESQIKYPFFLKTDGKGNPFSFVPYLHPVSQRSVYSMAQASDGGYLLCGTDSSATVRMLVIKTNENGDTAWSRTYSVNDVVGVSTRGVSVCATREGGFIVCGVLQRQRGAGQDAISSLVYIVKANSMGAVEWQKELTRTQLGNAIGYSIQQPLGDEGYIICGEIASRDITSGSVTGTDMFIVKTDARGDTLWTKTYNRGVHDVALSVQKDADGYVIGGYSVAALSDMVTGYIMKVNSRGDSLWTYPITTVSGNSAVISVRVTPDNGSIAAGYSHNSLGSGDDALLVKLSSEGKEVWRKTHGSLMAERAYSVAALSDSGFVYTGFTTRTINNSTSTDIYLVRTDANGNMVQE
jgi:hypothetical protein